MKMEIVIDRIQFPLVHINLCRLNDDIDDIAEHKVQQALKHLKLLNGVMPTPFVFIKEDEGYSLVNAKQLPLLAALARNDINIVPAVVLPEGTKKCYINYFLDVTLS
jgi:hypothetical protein